MSDKFETGMAVRRQVLGDAHVDRAEAAKTPFDEPFQTLITEGAWGTVWARDGLSRRDRSLITLALLAALGHWDEVAMHVRATANTGATPDEVREAMLEPLNTIVDSVRVTLERCPPELSADLVDRGLVLAGGGALLRGLDKLLSEETGLPVIVADDPLTCVARGGGMAMERMDRHTIDLLSTE